MTTYYYVKSNKIEEAKSVKDAEYMAAFLKRPVYTALKSVPIPEGYKLDGRDIVPTAETLKAQERTATIARLAEIDREAIRPLRAVAAGTQTTADTDKLAALEAEAGQLRSTL
jgi:hypothetical protein